MKKILIAAAAAAAALSAGAAQAANGDTVTCDITGGSTFTCSSPTAVEGAGVEFQIGNLPSAAYFDIDFSGNMLTVTALAPNSLGATILNLSNLTVPYTSATFLGQTGFNGLDAGDLSFNAGLVTIDMRGTDSNTGAFYQIGLSGTVPEPASWAMMIGGFALLGATMRRRSAAVRFA